MKNVPIIADKLVYVPTTNPSRPINTITPFFIIINALEHPVLVRQNTQHSMMAGKASPKNERHKAPNNEMNSSRFGMATANKTVSMKLKWKLVRHSLTTKKKKSI